MSQIWFQLSDDDPIRQGDIIRCPLRTEGDTWKFILTADCDIAQNKSGQHYTWLQIVTAQSWLEKFWAVEQLRRTTERQSRIALDMLNAQIRRTNPALTSLAYDDLVLWQADETEDDILNAIWGASPPPAKVRQCLQALRLLKADEPENAIDKLKSVYRILGRPIEEFRTNIRDAFSGGGFPDFFFLPELPGEDSKGFVVLLRDIESAPMEHILRSAREARLADRPDAPQRIGRLSDRLRFAISQKFAFLYSRIGLQPEFETACEETAEVLSVILGLSEA